LAAILWGVANQQLARVPGQRWAVPLLATLASVGWIGWMVTRSRQLGGWPLPAFLALTAVAGGVLVSFAPVATAFVAVAALGAGIALELEPALLIASAGVVALALAVLASGAPTPGELIAGGAVGAAAGLMAGTSRRQYVQRARQAEDLLAERVRADAERDRAAALAERNRLGREIHDVLAHSLGALSVQLEAAGALLDHGGDPDQARQLVHDARQLAIEGLADTRRAVGALRDTPVDLVEQLVPLASREGAHLVVTGHTRPLTPGAGLALYRVAQEALTNARKHAPGAAIRVTLAFECERAVLSVHNDHTPDQEARRELGASGGGYGLRGMRERVELAGGRVAAGPAAGGWRVEATVPV
jgi:signal transduction histidine kinase